MQFEHWGHDSGVTKRKKGCSGMERRTGGRQLHASKGIVWLRTEGSVGIGRSNGHPIKCGRTSEKTCDADGNK